MYIDYDTIINSGASISNALHQTVEALENYNTQISNSSCSICDLQSQVNCLWNEIEQIKANTQLIFNLKTNVEQLKKDIAVLRSRMTVAEGKLATAPATSAQSEIPNSKSDLEIFGGIGKRRELPLLDDYADIDKWYNDFLKGL